MTYIKDHPAYIGHVKSTRFDWIEIKDVADPLKTYITKQPIKASANTSAVVFNYEILKANINIDLEKYNGQEQNNDVSGEEKNAQKEPQKEDDLPF